MELERETSAATLFIEIARVRSCAGVAVSLGNIAGADTGRQLQFGAFAVVGNKREGKIGFALLFASIISQARATGIVGGSYRASVSRSRCFREFGEKSLRHYSFLIVPGIRLVASRREIRIT